MNIFNQLLRGALFFILAIFGMTMAFIFMISTAIAVGVLYVVAKIKGRPFGVRAYWDTRNQAGSRKNKYKSEDVVDVKMRELP